MRTYILNLRYETLARGMEKQVTMQEPSAKKPAPTKKRKCNEIEESVTLLFKGEPWNPEKKEEHLIALQNAFRLSQGGKRKGRIKGVSVSLV